MNAPSEDEDLVLSRAVYAETAAERAASPERVAGPKARLASARARKERPSRAAIAVAAATPLDVIASPMPPESIASATPPEPTASPMPPESIASATPPEPTASPMPPESIASATPPEPTASATPVIVPATGSVPAHAPRNDAVFGALQYESRFRDVILYADAYALGAARRVQPYGVLHSSVDSRSSTSGVNGPIIYNDNAEIISGGVRYNLGSRPGTFLFVEGGEGFSLVGKGNHPDFRYGFDTWSEKGSASRARTSYGFSAASYSRYNADVIAYGSILHDVPLRRGMRGIVGADAAFDAHRDYFNNIAEIVAGVQAGTPHLQFRLLGAVGTYLSRGIGIPVTRPYASFRPTIIWSRQL